jgi:hypothetical protein
MQTRTQYRLAMLENGYVPLLNDCKRCTLPSWPRMTIDAAEVKSWDRSAFLTTGMRIDGDLAVIDADITDAGLIAALAAALDKEYPELFRHGLVRHAGGVKEAWLCRTKKPFARLASWRWNKDGNPKAPAHRVECFGSKKARQFGVDGPHSRNKTFYHFTDGASPATTTVAQLPVLPKDAFAKACNLLDQIAAAAGLQVAEDTRNIDLRGAVYDLTNDMRFMNEHSSFMINELEAAWCAAHHEGRDLRVTSSFLGHGANPTKCIIGYSQHCHCIFVHDFGTGITHMPADRGSSILDGYLDAIKKRSAEQ